MKLAYHGQKSTLIRNIRFRIKSFLFPADALYSSLILDGKAEFLEQLTTWLDGETNWHLCYRASKYGWRSADFHSRCDFKGPTVTIVRVGYYIFGGYSDIPWGGMSN